MPQSHAACSVTHFGNKSRLEIDITDVRWSATIQLKKNVFIFCHCFYLSGSALLVVHVAVCCQRTDWGSWAPHTSSLTGRVPLISIDQHWFDLYWFSWAQFPAQSIGKWMPFYFNLPQRRNMIYNTKAMSLQLWNRLLKNSFEAITKKRSHQLTLFSALLMVAIV